MRSLHLKRTLQAVVFLAPPVYQTYVHYVRFGGSSQFGKPVSNFMFFCLVWPFTAGVTLIDLTTIGSDTEREAQRMIQQSEYTQRYLDRKQQ